MKIDFTRFKKISWKLTILFALIFSVLIISLNAGTLFGVRYFLIGQSKNQVQNISELTVQIITGHNGDKIDLFDPKILNAAQSDSEINIKITDPNGIIVNSSNNFNTDKLIAFLDPDKVKKVEVADENFIVKNSVIMVDGKVKAYLQVVNKLDKDYDFIELLFFIMAAADCIGVVLSVLTGYLLSRKMLNPIDKITKTAKEISISDLNRRIDVGKTDDELARLAITFNEMIQRLKSSFEKQNQFVSDASHELRTPISVIQGYIGLIDRWGKDDKDVLQESVDAIKNETVSMTKLVEKLLFLARGDMERIKINKDNFNFSKLADEVIKESNFIAPHHHFHYEIDQNLDLYADRQLVKQMLRALVDNSIKFTAEDGEINISAEKVSDKTKITFSDNGIGIPKDEIDNIFDRFYRVDKARTKEFGGSGLGLSIVKWIVESHDGSIYAESTLGKGVSIIISL